VEQIPWSTCLGPQSLSEGYRGAPQHPFAQGMIPGALCETLKLGKGVLRFTHLQQSYRRFNAMLVLLLQVSLHSFHATDLNLSQRIHLVNWGVDPSVSPKRTLFRLFGHFR